MAAGEGGAAVASNPDIPRRRRPDTRDDPPDLDPGAVGDARPVSLLGMHMSPPGHRDDLDGPIGRRPWARRQSGSRGASRSADQAHPTPDARANTTAARRAAPEQAMPEQAMPEQTVPEQAAPHPMPPHPMSPTRMAPAPIPPQPTPPESLPPDPAAPDPAAPLPSIARSVPAPPDLRPPSPPPAAPPQDAPPPMALEPPATWPAPPAGGAAGDRAAATEPADPPTTGPMVVGPVPALSAYRRRPPVLPPSEQEPAAPDTSPVGPSDGGAVGPPSLQWKRPDLGAWLDEPAVPPPPPVGWIPNPADYRRAILPAPADHGAGGPPARSPEKLSRELTWPDVEPAVRAAADARASRLRAAPAGPAVMPLVVASRRIVVGGFGGGCGRTAVTAGVGLALTVGRGERVVAVDASPDQRGALAGRAGIGQPIFGIRDLVAARTSLTSLDDVRRFVVSGSAAGLEVLPGPRDLAGPGLSGDEAAAAVDELARWYPVVLVDAPPGWSQPVPARLIAAADVLLLVCRAGVGDLAAADDALTALARGGRADLASAPVVAVVATRPGRWSRRTRRRMERLADRVAAVVPVPYDPALADGRPFTWGRLRRRTRTSFDRLARALDTAPAATLAG
jgi:MinD-like ATPase involved in chromosome partitioning or flagellar assembly